MLQVIAVIDGVAAFCILVAMTSGRIKSLPHWHRIWLAIIACGLAAQPAIEFGPVDRIGLPLWALKDLGLWGLVTVFIVHEMRNLIAK